MKAHMAMYGHHACMHWAKFIDERSHRSERAKINRKK
jgi:hypothetical protein